MMAARPRWVGGAAMATLAVLLGSGLAQARPTIRASFFSVYPGAVGSRLDNLPSISGHCGVCHYAFTGAGPKNPYGDAVATAIAAQPNTDAGRQAGIKSIENVDHDTDGYTTLTEITNLVTYANTPTFPGLKSANVGSVSGVNVNDILNYLTPTMGADTTPPVVTVTSPDGGQSWAGGSAQGITWTATDNVGVTSVDVFYRDSETASWKMIARSVPNTGSWTWFVHNTPATAARVRVLARDAAQNTGEDLGNAVFTITAQGGGIAPTTLRDFDMPGTQPFGGGSFTQSADCKVCHGGYNTAVEPGHNFSGSMMAQAGRDPLFYACLAVAEQDAPGAGDMCLRCHQSFGWMAGRSTPTDGSQMIPSDRDGVSCDLCHRMVDPVYKPGISPVEDTAVIGGLLPGHTPFEYANGQFVTDPDPRKRGPFLDTIAPHSNLYSAFHRTGDFCGTCHDVSNPVFVKTVGQDYTLGPLDAPATTIASDQLMPLERTYSEWKNSSFPAGVYAPAFAGNKADGIVAICQDCHMSDVSGKGCNDPNAPTRPDLPLHDMTGGSSWMPGVVASLYPAEVDAAALSAGASRATAMLQKAATVELGYATTADSFDVSVTVTNKAGHKLPTGYPEGRRMWLRVTARDAGSAVVWQSGAWDPASGELSHSPKPVVYEAELGISPALAGALGLQPGKSFHFALNDTLIKDNRIPPLGFRNSVFATFGGMPVDPDWAGPGARYADLQNWDTSYLRIPITATTVTAELLYQSTSNEYVEFLRDQNTTNGTGTAMYDAWVANGRAAPVVMASATMELTPTGVPVDEASGPLVRGFSVGRNPFAGALDMRLDLSRAAPARMEVYNVRGQRISRVDLGTLPGGMHRLTWNGGNEQGRDAGSGLYWIRVTAGDRTFVRQVVRLK